MLRIEENALQPEAFRKLFLSAGWEPPCLRQIGFALWKQGAGLRNEEEIL